MTTTELLPAEAGLRGLLRRHALVAYFVIALLFSWAAVALWVAMGWPTTFWTILAITLGPTVASLIMTGVTQGAAGVRTLLGRLVLWRLPPVWYAAALIGIPAVMIIGMALMPGAVASFDPLTVETWLGYPWLFVLVTFLGGPFLEEPGWRGFALPRLQHRFGPLWGTLLLGLLWAAWHYPQYMMPDWAAQNGGFTAKSVAVYTLSVIPLTVILTFVFNNTRGSLLLAILTHASINTFSVYVIQMFPAQAESQIFGIVGFGAAAVLVIVLTRGRLGYDRYLTETTPFERGAA
jgi:membrane protease YdiL (CAAX protease family)